MTRAVVLAAGRGTRMRRPDPAAELDPAQAARADAGLKMLVPFHGHPFLAFVLHELAEAGFREVALVVGPGDDPVRAAATALPTHRLRLALAVQPEPLGSADALLAAEAAVAGDPFLVINSDNLYPATVLRRMRALDGPGVAAFERAALVRGSNVSADRVSAFGLLEARDGWLTGVIEKPAPELVAAHPDRPVSMTCWRFGPGIFDACRRVEPSPRGERELTDAVRASLEAGERYRVVDVAAGVLDLSRREDIPGVEARLRGRAVRL